MIVLKKSTTSLPILNLGMHEYRTDQSRDYTLTQDSSFYKYFTGGISVKVYGFSQERRGDRSQMYHLYEKDRYS